MRGQEGGHQTYDNAGADQPGGVDAESDKSCEAGGGEGDRDWVDQGCTRELPGDGCHQGQGGDVDAVEESGCYG